MRNVGAHPLRPLVEKLSETDVHNRASKILASLAAGEPGRIDVAWLYTLGCQVQDKSGVRILKIDATTKSYAVAYLPAITTLMAQIIRQGNADSYTVASVLTGLRRHECWRDCLETRDGAYALSVAIFHFVARLPLGFKLYAETKYAVCDILNAWLEPSVAWREVPSISEICRHMFVAPWCALALPGEMSFDDDEAVARLVANSWPPFIKGVGPEDISSQVMDALPALEGT
jgi:hypothetical protein